MTECFTNCFDLTVSSIEINEDFDFHFHDAAIEGDVSRVESMLQEGVSVDYVDDEYDRTALMIASRYNRTNVIQLLLQNGADVNKRDCYGHTPVHYAADWNSTEAISMLIEHGASINIKNNEGDKPIDFARQFKREAAVRMLEQL